MISGLQKFIELLDMANAKRQLSNQKKSLVRKRICLRKNCKCTAVKRGNCPKHKKSFERKYNWYLKEKGKESADMYERMMVRTGQILWPQEVREHQQAS